MARNDKTLADRVTMDAISASRLFDFGINAEVSDGIQRHLPKDIRAMQASAPAKPTKPNTFWRRDITGSFVSLFTLLKEQHAAIILEYKHCLSDDQKDLAYGQFEQGVSGLGNSLYNLPSPSAWLDAKKWKEPRFHLRHEADDGIILIAVGDMRGGFPRDILLGIPNIGWVESARNRSLYDFFSKSAPADVRAIQNQFGVRWEPSTPPLKWTDSERAQVSLSCLGRMGTGLDR